MFKNATLSDENPYVSLEILSTLRDWSDSSGIILYTDKLIVESEETFKVLYEEYCKGNEPVKISEDDYKKIIVSKALEKAGVPSNVIHWAVDWDNPDSVTRFTYWIVSESIRYGLMC